MRWVLALMLALAGCQPAPNRIAPMPVPSNYRAIVAAYVRANFFDPYTVRDASIASVGPGQIYKEGTLGHEPGWIVCLRANARNCSGAYTGLKHTAMALRDGGVVASIDDPEWHNVIRMQCGGARYEPFPEIEMLDRKT